MQFTTKIPITKSDHPVDYSSKILLLGSCFSENIGAKFAYYKFQATSNPFGIIFNPFSIDKIISRIVNKNFFTEKDIFFHNERWHCFEVHSEWSNENKKAFIQNLNEILSLTHSQISALTHCIITYGTSWVYRLKSSNEVVANCHKMSQSQFDKEILSVEVIEKSIKNTVDLIRKINPNCHVMFTVSPVRHLKDGFVENQQSKAHLLTAIHATHNSQFITHNYFPSYEIMMDELRDYRFYAEDMLHPNQVAIDYIWQRFCESTIAEASYNTMETVAAIQKGWAHRPFNPNSERHQQFLDTLHQKIVQLQEEYPFIKF
ncbi:MAG: GSCFA domain-containing protein [Flavobacterium sp.]